MRGRFFMSQGLNQLDQPFVHGEADKAAVYTGVFLKRFQGFIGGFAAENNVHADLPLGALTRSVVFLQDFDFLARVPRCLFGFGLYFRFPFAQQGQCYSEGDESDNEKFCGPGGIGASKRPRLRLPGALGPFCLRKCVFVGRL